MTDGVFGLKTSFVGKEKVSALIVCQGVPKLTVRGIAKPFYQIVVRLQPLLVLYLIDQQMKSFLGFHVTKVGNSPRNCICMLCRKVSQKMRKRHQAS